MKHKSRPQKKRIRSDETMGKKIPGYEHLRGPRGKAFRITRERSVPRRRYFREAVP